MPHAGHAPTHKLEQNPRMNTDVLASRQLPGLADETLPGPLGPAFEYTLPPLQNLYMLQLGPTVDSQPFSVIPMPDHTLSIKLTNCWGVSRSAALSATPLSVLPCLCLISRWPWGTLPATSCAGWIRVLPDRLIT